MIRATHVWPTSAGSSRGGQRRQSKVISPAPLIETLLVGGVPVVDAPLLSDARRIDGSQRLDHRLDKSHFLRRDCDDSALRLLSLASLSRSLSREQINRISSPTFARSRTGIYTRFKDRFLKWYSRNPSPIRYRLASRPRHD